MYTVFLRNSTLQLSSMCKQRKSPVKEYLEDCLKQSSTDAKIVSIFHRLSVTFYASANNVF